MRKLLLAASLLCSMGANAQPRPEAPPSLCDKLAGAERKRCVAEEQDRRERLGRDEADKPRECDRLLGPEKELCLKRGGTVRAGDQAGEAGPAARTPSGASGGTAAPQPR